jgi:elongation factor P
MAMLDYNEVTERKYIILDGAPYEVLDSRVFRMQQRKPVNQTKLRNLISGKVTQYSFHQSEKVHEADIEKYPVKYLYTNRGEYWFSETNDLSKRFKLPAELVGDAGKFLKPNTEVDAVRFNEAIIGLKLPIKVDLKVTEAPPAVKGDTVTGGNKQITLETGAVINAPMFIQEGEIIRVNTETGDYVERIGK